MRSGCPKAPGRIEFDRKRLTSYLCSAGAHWHTQHGRLMVR
jgi:hypothetical protein